jgi:hypothetical protein
MTASVGYSGVLVTSSAANAASALADLKALYNANYLHEDAPELAIDIAHELPDGSREYMIGIQIRMHASNSGASEFGDRIEAIITKYSSRATEFEIYYDGEIDIRFMGKDCSKHEAEHLRQKLLPRLKHLTKDKLTELIQKAQVELL